MGKRGPQPKFDDKTKWCNRCKKWLPLGDFGNNKRTASGKAPYCKPCHNTYCRSYWTSVQAYEHILARDFKTSPEAYLAMWREQAHKCAICTSNLTLYNRNTQVDWDESNQRVRGLVCADCSAGMKKFHNSTALLENAVQYLTHKGARLSRPLVSCLTPTFNRREFWPRCVRCFQHQDYPNLEWIIIDNGTDPIFDLLPVDSRIKYHRIENSKLSHGLLMNKAFEHAEGEYGIVFDDDDWYASDRVSKQIRPLEDNPSLMVSGTRQLYYYLHGSTKAFRYVNQTSMDWLGAIALRKSAWETHRFNDKTHGADFDLLHKIPREQWCDLNDPALLVAAIHNTNASPKQFPNASFVDVSWAMIHTLTKGDL